MRLEFDGVVGSERLGVVQQKTRSSSFVNKYVYGRGYLKTSLYHNMVFTGRMPLVVICRSMVVNQTPNLCHYKVHGTDNTHRTEQAQGYWVKQTNTIRCTTNPPLIISNLEHAQNRISIRASVSDDCVCVCL